MLHLGGFGEDADLAGTLQNLAALADPQLFVSGDFIRVPSLDKVVAIAGGLASGSTQILQLVAPSLREIGNYVVEPTNGGADADVEPDDPPKVVDLRNRPLQLVAGENLSAEAQSDTTGAAFQWLLALFMDEMRPMPNGPIRTMRFVNTATLTARAWTNITLTATEELAKGEYAVVGMRAVGASTIAARIVPRGSIWRPGAICGDVHTYQDHPMFRNGGLGEWARFPHDSIPTVDVLADLADTDTDVFLDLVKV